MHYFPWCSLWVPTYLLWMLMIVIDCCSQPALGNVTRGEVYTAVFANGSGRAKIALKHSENDVIILEQVVKLAKQKMIESLPDCLMDMWMDAGEKSDK